MCMQSILGRHSPRSLNQGYNVYNHMNLYIVYKELQNGSVDEVGARYSEKNMHEVKHINGVHKC